jgi:hypothetical protein
MAISLQVSQFLLKMFMKPDCREQSMVVTQCYTLTKRNIATCIPIPANTGDAITCIQVSQL